MQHVPGELVFRRVLIQSYWCCARARSQSARDWKSLRNLDLGDCSFGDDGARVIANAASLQNLEQLGLTNTQIESDGAKMLAESPNLASLRKLTVSGDTINENDRQVLIDRFGDCVEIVSSADLVAAFQARLSEPQVAAHHEAAANLMEIKDGRKVPSRRKLTQDQELFFQEWAGRLHVVESVEQAFSVIGIF